MRRRRGSNTDQQPLLSGVSVNFSDVNIMLLGSTQGGKSASGNTIIGSGDKFREDLSPEAVTRVCDSAQTEVGGQTITVIDTVGLSDTAEVKITDAQTEIEKMIQKNNLDVFLLVIRLGDPFTKEKAEVVNWIKDNFGEKVVDYTIVLFTHGDELPEPIEDYLGKCKALRSVVGQFSVRFHVFNNIVENQAQVTELLEKINRLRRDNRNCRYTEQDYAKAQKDLLQRKLLTGAAIGAGVGAGAGAAVGGGTTAAVAGGAVAVKVGAGVVIGAAGGALLLGAAVGAGVYFLARKYRSRQQ